MLKKFDEMRKVDVLPFCEKRDGMLYLNWAKCIDIELRMPEESIRKKQATREQKTFLASVMG